MKPLNRPESHRIEPLENRVAPAAILNGSTVQYRDVDQDLVTVKFSKNLFTGVDEDGDPLDPEYEAFQVFDFANGDLLLDDLTTPQELQGLSFDGLTNVPTGAFGITVTVEKAPGGDGLVDIGSIEGVAFTNIVIPGDLGRIDLLNGSGNTLGSLVVNSFGMRGVASQAVGGTMYSLIDGNVGKIEIKTHFSKARIELSDGNLGSLIIGGNIVGGNSFAEAGVFDVGGSIKKLAVGGDIIGFNEVAVSYALDSGKIYAAEGIGSATVGGSLIGGKGDSSGYIGSGASIKSLVLKGGITGGEGEDSGAVEASGSIGKISVGQNVTGGDGDRSGLILAVGNAGVVINGSLTGGTGEESGAVRVGNELVSLVVKGSVTGGDGERSAQIYGGNGIKSVTVSGDLIGGNGLDSGAVQSFGKINAVSIGRDLVGGDGDNSGSVVSGIDPDLVGDLGKVKIQRDLIGGAGIGSGAITSGGKLSGVTVGRDMLGGDGDYSASITSAFAMGTVKVLRNVTGAAGDFSAAVESGSKIASVAITGNLNGGTGIGSGSIVSHSLFTPGTDEQGDISKVTIGGAVTGGIGADSARIASAGDLKQIMVGSLLAGAGAGSASVLAGQDAISSGLLGKLQVKGDLDGGTTGLVVEGLRIGTVQVDGSILNKVTVAAWDDVSKVVVKGNVNGTAAEGVTLSGRGQADPKKTDVAIGTVDIGGNASYLNVLAGYDPAGNAANADAQINKVIVDGNWTAGSVVAGVVDTGADGFGNVDDSLIAGGDAGIVSRIASVVIGGTLAGTAAANDHFGFTAQDVGTVKIGGTLYGVIDPIPPTDDVSVREVV